MLLKRSQKRGFIKLIVLIIIALIVLKYVFHIDVKDILDSKIVQDIWVILKKIFDLLWDAIMLTLKFIVLILEKTKDFLSGLSQKIK